MEGTKAKGNRSQGIRRSDVVPDTGWAAIQQPDLTWTYAIAFCSCTYTTNFHLCQLFEIDNEPHIGGRFTATFFQSVICFAFRGRRFWEGHSDFPPNTSLLTDGGF